MKVAKNLNLVVVGKYQDMSLLAVRPYPPLCFQCKWENI